MHCVLFAEMDEVLKKKHTKKYLKNGQKYLKSPQWGPRHYNLTHKQGSHSDWKTWKNGKAFSSQGKVREF